MRYSEQDRKNLAEYSSLMQQLNSIAKRFCVRLHEDYFIKALAFVSAGIIDGGAPIPLGQLFKGWRTLDVYLRNDGIRVNGRNPYSGNDGKLLLRGLDSDNIQPTYVLNMLADDKLLIQLTNLPLDRIKDTDRWGLAVSFLTDVRKVLGSYRGIRDGDGSHTVAAPTQYTFLEDPSTLEYASRRLELSFLQDRQTAFLIIGDKQGNFNRYQGQMHLQVRADNNVLAFILHDDNIVNLIVFLKDQVKEGDKWMTQHMAQFDAIHTKYSQIDTVLLMKEKV